MNIVILGAGGQLGRELALRYPDAITLTRQGLDIADSAAVATYPWKGVDVIINAAAYTDVNGAETAEGRVKAWLINANGPANLARASQDYGFKLIHFSTDYVYDGNRSPHLEDEPFSPLGVYGQSKAAGDIAVSVVPEHYIFRIGWLVGDGHNFVRTAVDWAKRNISPEVVCDQIGRLTFTDQVADAVDHFLTTNPPFGTYNLSSSGYATSLAHITRAVFAEMDRRDLEVTDIRTTGYTRMNPRAAPRPLQSILCLAKIRSTGFDPSLLGRALHNYLRRIEAIPPTKLA